jgi:hypothetical protein
MSLSRISNLEHRRTNISDDVVSVYIDVLGLTGDEAHELRNRATFSNQLRQTAAPSAPISPLQALLQQFGGQISSKGIARLQKVLEEETGAEIASLAYSSTRTKMGAASIRKRPNRAPSPVPAVFAKIGILAEEVRSLVSTENQPTNIGLLLDRLSLEDVRFDYEVNELLPSFAEGAFACITGHASGHTLLLEEFRMFAALNKQPFARHAIAHEIGHHCLHSNLLESEGTLFLPPQELAKNRADADELGVQIEPVVENSVEAEAEVFATLLLVPWSAFLKGTTPEYLARDYREDVREVRRYYNFFKNPTLLDAFRTEFWESGRRDHPIFRDR